MMDADINTIDLFATRVRQMILHYRELRTRCDELQVMIDGQAETIRQMKDDIKMLENDNKTLKLAKMIAITDNDMEYAQKKIARLIRDVNKCITLISGDDEEKED